MRIFGKPTYQFDAENIRKALNTKTSRPDQLVLLTFERSANILGMTRLSIVDPHGETIIIVGRQHYCDF